MTNAISIAKLIGILFFVVSIVTGCNGGGGGTSTFTVGGTVSGLEGTGLVLQNNGGDDLAISADGSFTFATTLANNSSYAVTITGQPSNPNQTCAVTNDSGTLSGANVTNVSVTCTTTPYTVGGTVTGLAGTGLVLQNNGGDDLAVNANGSFTFVTPLADTNAYAVTVATQPVGQTCAVANGSGTVSGANVNNVGITCTNNPPPPTFTIGGTVSGLAGSGLVLQNNGGDNLAISADGSFTFATALADLSAYAVTVLTGPSNPNQTCSVTSGSGNLSGANVTSVSINCTTNTYTVGGSVTGLTGTVVLRNNGGDDLTISANGPFNFVTPLADLSPYAVTVLTNPSAPNQTCSVTSGSGNLSGANVTSVSVSCTTSIYTVGGTVSGLAGSGLVLQNNGGDNLAIGADGSFTFATALADLSAYAVTVLTQPGTPNQTCSVTNDTGNLSGANVTSVSINCTTNTYTVGGTVSGYTGTGLVLQNNGGDDLAISADGSFSFATPLDDGSDFTVSVLTQPSSPNQTCSVAGNSTLSGANYTDVTVTCSTDTYTVGGTVSGYTGTGLVLQNNGGDDLAISADGGFTFATALADTSPYTVTVLTDPSAPNQICSVTNDSGTLSGANVTNVTVSCINSYTVGGTVSGYTGTGLVLQNNGGDDLAISADGGFTFATALADLSAYAVTVLTDPSAPNQTCSVTNDSGNLSGANVTDVTISCTTITYTIGGTVSGLAGSGLVLQNNGGDDLAIGADGSFTFATALDDTSAYAVSVATQPSAPNQTCSVTNDSGNLSGANVTNVAINCSTNTYTVGGTVSGLAGSGLVLQNNGGDDLAIGADGSFTFATALDDTSAYAVSVATQPSAPNQTCSVTNDSGNLSGANVTDVTISCTTITYTVGGTVSGLAGSGLVLQNNGGDDLAIGADGSFTFATALDDTSAYAVSVATQPSAPAQTCLVANDSGNLSGANVTAVTITCTTNTYTVGGTVSGLAGSGLVLQNNGGDDLAISIDGSFSFATTLIEGDPYAVSVLTQPGSPTQNCFVSNGSGSMPAATVTDATIVCTSSVAALYPNNGANWNDYVDNDGSDAFSATDTNPCATGGTESYYASCLHGGEMRVVTLTGYASCTDLTAADTLDIFNWRCDDSTGTARLISTGLKEDKNLSDLINFTTPGWLANAVTISESGTPIAETPTTAWWSNPISVANAGGSLDTSGTIYLKTNTAVANYTLGANKVGFVIQPGRQVTGIGTDATDAVSAASVDFLWLEGDVNGAANDTGTSGNRTGIRWTSVSHSVMRDVRVTKMVRSGSGGIYLDSSSNNALKRIRVVYGIAKGVTLDNNSSYNTINDIITTNNRVAGIVLDNASTNNLLINVLAANHDNGTGGVGAAIFVGNASNDNKFMNLTVTNSRQAGISTNASSGTLLMNTAAANNRTSLYMNNGSNRTGVVDFASANNTAHSALIWDSSNNYFTGVLKVGNNVGTTCDVRDNNPPDDVNPGLVDVTCTVTGGDGTSDYGVNNAFSNAVLQIDVDTTASFSGKVLIDDTANGSDGISEGGNDGGRDNYATITDWLNFDNVYRAWGLEGGAYPSNDNRGPVPGCYIAGETTGYNDQATCEANLGTWMITARIWDWSLAISDTVLLDVLGVPTGGDTITHTWSDDVTTTTFLRHAVEILGDAIGNDDGLCESSEACIHTRNIGAYQGHGTLGAVTFTDGAISGVQLYQYGSNGDL